MALKQIVFNIAKGRVAELYNRVQTNDPSTAALGVMLLSDVGLEPDPVLKKRATVADVLAGSTNEAANSGYTRKLFTDSDLAPLAPDNVNDQMVIDTPDAPLGTIAAGDRLAKALIYYDPDPATSTDATRIPLVMEDFFDAGAPVVPNGGLVTASITGIFQAVDLPPPSGTSLPLGGTTGQVLTKLSSTDSDADWETPLGGSGIYPAIVGSAVYVPSTGVVTTDTPNLQAAHDALGTGGGTITLDQGPYVLSGNAINFTKPVHLIGTGPSGAGGLTAVPHDNYLTIGSTIQCSSGTGNAITVNTDGCTFEKLYIQNTQVAAPTAGAGIQIASLGRGTRIIDCCVHGFYINIDFVSGFYWIVDRCYIVGPVLAGIKIDDTLGYDSGDQILTSTSFVPGLHTSANSGTAIYWISGGGLRVTNCKVNNSAVAGSGTYQTAYAALVKDGTTTADLFIANNSFENTQYGIIIQNTGSHTGRINNILISGNELDNSITGISINPATGPFDRIDIHGNVGTSSFLLSNLTNLVLHGQAFATSARPSAALMKAGSWYYDTTLHKPGFADGSGNWKDAAGTTI